jgi:hypothetical protein
MPLVFIDLAFGGLKSTVPRYCILTVLSILLGVAYWLYRNLLCFKASHRILFAGLAAFLVSLEIYSDTVMSTSHVWDHKRIADQSLLDVSAVLNRDLRPVLLVTDDANGCNNAQMVALSRYLNPKINLQFFKTPSMPIIPLGTNRFYLFNVSAQFKRFLIGSGHFDLSPCQKMNYLLIAQRK